MRLVPLGSGSRGNSALVELGGVRLLVDAGLSARQLAGRLESVGVAPGGVDGILLSHEHEDHSRGAETFSRKHGTPVLCSVETLEAMDGSPAHFAEWRPLGPAGIDLGTVRVEPFPVPHDAAAPVGFVILGMAATSGASLVFLGIFLFAVGEMISSPRIQEYITWIAPKEKAGLYMGANFLAVAIGGLMSGRPTYTTLSGYFADQGRPGYVWYVLAAHMIVAIVVLWIFVKTLGEFKEQEE